MQSARSIDTQVAVTEVPEPEFAPPEHMDLAHRNDRLYRKLMADGYCVMPVYEDKQRLTISYLVVSAGLLPPEAPTL